ncbi:iron uptake porin [Spirulina subsalsa FACHB-351]|uniref:Iron uptake porin n=1 Tax=Spirulina subsalsa FACHB-351 TaxID=234711 RepID=A0ABT3L693_9CYAN|nr:iron uptake porin [Spirulina subsalsa]MCW6036962.1 iron uptake porin [Spirulina subsalsa FACHB-351]
MSNNLRRALLAAPATLGALLAVAGTAVANPVSTSDLLEQVNSYTTEGNTTLGQSGFPGASQFGDVSPGDWAFQALDDLVRRYGCLAGYPDGTFRGNRALSRYEFAAGLNACLQQLERIIAETTAEFVTREDLETLRRLLQEFEAELVTLGTRVDNLESRTSFLEDNQFSTTTKLLGEVVFNLDVPSGKRAVPTFITGTTGNGLTNNGSLGDTIVTDAAGNVIASEVGFREPPRQEKMDSNLAFSYRARLNFDTSFVGSDRLRTRLQARNARNLTDVANIGTDGLRPDRYGNSNNSVELSKLWYYFPLGRNIRFHVGATGMSINDIINSSTTSPYSKDSLPLGMVHNPAFFETHGSGGAAVGANIKLSDNLALDIGYFAANANEPDEGLFGGSYALPVQLSFKLSNISMALGYSRTYAPSGAVNLTAIGDRSRTPFGQNATSGNHYHLAASVDLGRAMNLSGWFGYTNAIGEATEAALVRGRSADIWNWGINLAFPDLGRDGAVLVTGFSQLPYASHIENRPNVRNASYLGNLEYRFPVNDNIEIAPGLFTILNPQGDARNGAVWGALLRTTFKF